MINSRIRLPFYIFFLNPVYNAACSLRSLRSNYVILKSFQTYFDETLEKLSTSGKPIYVMGDFNINLLNAETCGFTEGFLLFLMYINDIYNSSKKLSFYLCADDTNLLYAKKDLKSLETVIIIELQKVCDWLNTNKLTINAKKFNFVIFRASQKKLNYQINIRIYNNFSSSDTFLECKDYVKFLGVLIDKNLTWKYHIDYIASKIIRVVGIISRLRWLKTVSSTFQDVDFDGS